jgi:hypothetical protein
LEAAQGGNQQAAEPEVIMSDIAFVPSINDADADQAYEQVAPEAEELEEERLVSIRIDIPAAIVTAVGVIPKLQLVSEPAAQLPEFDKTAIEKLPVRVLALASAQARYVQATSPQQMQALVDLATERRNVFVADAKALIARGYLAPDCLQEFKAKHGFKNAAFELMGVTRLLKANWAAIEGQTGLKFEELTEANKLAWRVVSAVAYKEQSPERVAKTSDMRTRMFTLFVESYEQARRAVIFLRWNHGDADQIAPSLYANRVNPNANRKSNGDEKPEGTPVVSTAATDIINGTTPTAVKVPVGMPGSDPLMPA